MFYYPNVLQRHSGCFATIWFAATKGIRVSRRELLRVNVKKTCWDILDYVTAQVPPPQPDQPRPRFSLYLSSQLQYGVVVVYHRQCGFLLEEVQQAIDRLLRFKRCIHIDMAEADRIALDVADRLNTMEEAEGAQDPFFGVMDVDELPSPYKIHLAECVIAEHSLVSSLHNTPDEKGFRSPPAAITLTEREPFVMAAAECFEGDDLPEATTKDIDLLMDQPDMFRLEGEEPQKGEQTEEPEAVGSFIDQLKETIAELDGELDGRPGETPPDADAATAAALEVTPPRVAMPTPPSEASGATEGSGEEAAVRPLRRPRRRLVFADPDVQISERVMKEQVENLRVETLQQWEVLLDFQAVKLPAAAQLFGAPCGPLLHADLLSRWRDRATLAARPGRDEQQEDEEDEEEQDKEILREEMRRRRSGLKEMSIDSGLRSADVSSATDVILDVSKSDKSVSDVMTPVSRWSPQEEIQPPMEPIAEEVIALPEAQTESESRDTLSWISSVLQRFGEVAFDSLLPPEADRFTAAHTLLTLLELLSAGRVELRQATPYGDIMVAPPVSL